MKIRKAVIPAAGFGTRFLPQTKAMPKEMLPIVDKPVIQYVVEELVEAGIQDIIIVTGYHKRGIEDHFDVPNLELIENLKMGGGEEKPMLQMVENISNLANFYYVRQKGPYGNGTPLLNVRHLIGDEPFIYTWSDEFILSDTDKNVFQQAMDMYEKYNCSILSSIRANRPEDYDRYGYASGTEIEPGVIDCEMLVEKPGKEKAPSELATVTCYTFTPDIFNYLDEAKKHMTKGELYWNDAAKLMMADGKRFIAAEVKGAKYYDTGNKLEYMKTVAEFALRHPDLNGEFKVVFEIFEFVMEVKKFLLKLSGESLLGDRDHGIDPVACQKVASEIAECLRIGYKIAVVIGGGNIFRGIAANKNGLDRATADYIGMLATIMNSLALSQALEDQGVDTRVMSSLVSAEVAEPYVRNKAIAHMEMGRLVILAGGTGNPYFTTDTAAVLRALELNCDVVLKGAKVDGVYDSDPSEVFGAHRLDEIKFDQALVNNLKIMDATAFAMCRDNNLPIIVFDFFEKGNLLKVLQGEKIGTRMNY